ncbi:hypothetical protein [Burkholderia cenocepacia]|uniref:hypothetical protein n=1 Tax=Burkholderia cenocepacia TaxID=95486 RepID=UPI0013661797|nr:hypothetical protein [Burkholderia cenocepacia]
MACFTRNIAARRNKARKQQDVRPERHPLDRGASIPTREMKLQMSMLRTVLRLPPGALGPEVTDAVRSQMEGRLKFFTALLAERDRLASGEIDAQELRRRTRQVCREHAV